MIEELVASWSLFRTTYLAGWLLAALLALIGVWVVARNQIFLGVAVAQASTLGIAGALWLAPIGAAAGLAWAGSEWVAGSLAVGASIATALLTAREPVPGHESAEAVTGWVYLLSASLPVLMLAHSPHGLEEVHQLVFSTILGATTADVWIFALLLVATALAVARLHTRLLLFALDPELAAAIGLRRRLWNTAVAVWLGLAVGLSIRVSGLLYTFGCLTLPALVAKGLARELRTLLWVAPLVGLAAAAVGFFAAHAADVPPAHATVALLCATLLAVWAVRAAGPRAGSDG